MSHLALPWTLSPEAPSLHEDRIKRSAVLSYLSPVVVVDAVVCNVVDYTGDSRLPLILLLRGPRPIQTGLTTALEGKSLLFVRERDREGPALRAIPCYRAYLKPLSPISRCQFRQLIHFKPLMTGTLLSSAKLYPRDFFPGALTRANFGPSLCINLQQA